MHFTSTGNWILLLANVEYQESVQVRLDSYYCHTGKTDTLNLYGA